MNKVILYSDMHVGADRVNLDLIIKTLEWINQVALERNISLKYNLGDLLDFYNHTKSKMRITPEFFSMLSKFGSLLEGHVILRGNHEYHEEGDLLTVFELFGAEVIVEPKEISIGGKSILFMPFYDDLGIRNIKYNFKQTGYDYVFGHYDISGASFESGFKDVRKDSDILNLFSFDRMYIGHYHIRQQIRTNIWSIGSCQSRAKTNNPERMGITILDIETGETEFLENPYAVYNYSEEVATVGVIKETAKKYNVLDEIDNFKLEKTGLDAIIDYTERKRGTYDESIIDYTIEYLESLKK